MDLEKIGKFISLCRNNLGLTQLELANKIGVTDRAVSKWENGRGLPDASYMVELCDVLGISVNELLNGSRGRSFRNREKEIKVINIDSLMLEDRIKELGGVNTYTGVRTIYALDTKDKLYLNTYDKLIRVTDASSVKVTMHINQSNPSIKDEVRFKTNNLSDTLEFFHNMGLDPITKVCASRTSYTIGNISLDIDKFPLIPAFLEIDIEHLEDDGYTIESFIELLNLDMKNVVVLGTEDIHNIYGYDYFEEYEISD